MKKLFGISIFKKVYFLDHFYVGSVKICVSNFYFSIYPIKTFQDAKNIEVQEAGR